MGSSAPPPAPGSAPRPLQDPPSAGEPRLDALARLVAVVDRLRAPDGCPWDLEQTTGSMAPSLVEEAHEMLEAIEAGDDEATVEEAGDLLLVVTLICRIAQDEGRFDLARCAEGVADKLVRRHPHVFGDGSAGDAAQVASSWERIKQRERREKRADASALAGVPAALPALQRAHRIGAKAMAAGFRWSSAAGALAKLREELEELEAAFREAEASSPPGGGSSGVAGEIHRASLAHELGDVCLAAAQLGSYLELDPERAARDALRRFEARFRRMEAELGEDAREAGLERWMQAWRRAKEGEDPGPSPRPPA